MDERRDTGLNDGFGVSADEMLDASQTPVVQVMGEGIQDSAVEPQGDVHDGWAVQPQGWGVSDDDGGSGREHPAPAVPALSSAMPGASFSGASRVPDAASPGIPYAPGAPFDPPGGSASSTAAKAGVMPLVLGILSIVTAGVPVVGIALGVVALVASAKAIKRYGKDGKAVAGRVCGIVGIAFSAVVLAASVVGTAAFTSHLSESTAPSDRGSYSSSTFNEEDPAGYLADTDADDRAAEEAVRAELDKFAAGDPDLAAWLAAKVDELFSTSGYSLADIGVDSRDVAEWMMADFSYEMDGSFTFSDGTGTVYADLETRDMFELLEGFDTASQDMIDSGLLDAMDEATMLGQFGQAFVASMGAAEDSRIDFYAAFDVVEQDGAWVVDRASWEEEIAYVFGLF